MWFLEGGLLSGCGRVAIVHVVYNVNKVSVWEWGKASTFDCPFEWPLASIIVSGCQRVSTAVYTCRLLVMDFCRLCT